MTVESSRSDRVWRLAAASLLLGFLVLHVYSFIARADREPHMDETEYLHASWMMANGEKLYETFFEHHSPLFFKSLEPFAPGEIADVRPYVVHTRWLAGILGLITMVSLAATLWRVAPESAPIGIALLLATGPMWLRGFADVRAEVFALAFFFAGTAIAFLVKGSFSGIGIGLIAISCLWNPKWPVACVVVGVIWLIRCQQRVGGAAAALATTAAGFVALRLIVPFDTWWFFNFEVNRALAGQVAGSQEVLDAAFQGGVPFLLVPSAFHPWVLVPASLIVGAAVWIDRNPYRLLPLALLAASFLELRFLYPWPAIWIHYYLMWSVAGAAVIGIVPSSLNVVIQRAGLRAPFAGSLTRLVSVTILLLAVAHVVAVAPSHGDRSTYWISEKWFRERLRPGDVVWIEPTRHPISVRDAHYYWFSVGQMARGAEVLRRTDRGRHFLPPPDNFPTCTQPANLRFTLNPARGGLDEASECLQRLIETGRARKTMFFDVYETRLLESGTNRSH